MTDKICVVRNHPGLSDGASC